MVGAPQSVIFDGFGDPDSGGGVAVGLGTRQRVILLDQANGTVEVLDP